MSPVTFIRSKPPYTAKLERGERSCNLPKFAEQLLAVLVEFKGATVPWKVCMERLYGSETAASRSALTQVKGHLSDIIQSVDLAIMTMDGGYKLIERPTTPEIEVKTHATT